MIPTSFEYVRAKNLSDALKAMGKNTKVIAGGHSLLPLLRFRLAQPDMLIDIGQLRELKGIKRAGGGLRMGQAVGASTAKGERPKDRPYTVAQVLSTIYRAIGIDPSITFPNGSGRPMYVLDDREPVRELLG